MVFNKIDAYTFIKKDEDDLTPTTRANWTLEDLKKTWMSNLEGKDCVFISAATKENVETLRDLLYERVKAIHVDRYPYDNLLY
jgi:GTP-binding protein HflX